MAVAKLLLASALLVAVFHEARSHGRLMEPINRSSVWRLGKWDDAVRNDEDNENFCGGANVQHQTNGGKCGPCGDNYSDEVPRKNENGGLYGKGYVVKKYKSGETIKVVIDLTANHLGSFYFSICKLADAKTVETEECFEKYPLKVVLPDGTMADKYPAGDESKEITLKAVLPKGLTCERCTFRWHYRTGNTWGICDEKTGKGAQGCGPQETFRGCSDIAIV